MNSEYATKQENTLEALKKSSAGMIRTQTEREYLPKVVAIPTEQWEAFCAWAREAVTFQPTLYKQIEALATREELTEMTENFLSEQDGTALELQKSITQSLVGIAGSFKTTLEDVRAENARAGRAREQYISSVKAELDSRYDKLNGLKQEAEGLLKKFHRYMVTTIIAAAGSSALLSAIVFLLMR